MTPVSLVTPGTPPTHDRRPRRTRRVQTFRVTQRRATGRDATSMDVDADGAEQPTMSRDALGTMRDARARLRDMARVAADAELERAIAAFVKVAWDVGFSRVTAGSIVAAALEEGLPRRRGRPVSVTAATWERRAQTIYDAIALRSA